MAKINTYTYFERNVTILGDYITVKDFANLAGVSTQAIYQRIDKDLKRFVKVENGKKLILMAALEFFKCKKENQVDCQEAEKYLKNNSYTVNGFIVQAVKEKIERDTGKSFEEFIKENQPEQEQHQEQDQENADND